MTRSTIALGRLIALGMSATTTAAGTWLVVASPALSGGNLAGAFLVLAGLLLAVRVIAVAFRLPW